MLQSLHEQVQQARKDLAHAIQENLLSRQFGATIILALVHLSSTETKIRKTTSLKERRQLINEFNTVSSAITKGLRLLQNAEGSLGRTSTDMPELRQRLQDSVAQGR